MRRNSLISAEARGTGNGGNINIIDTGFIVAVPGENSDIIANAFEGRGGNVEITAQSIFGTEFREDQTPQSVITASSEFGVDGVVEINTPNVDASFGLVANPIELVDASRLIASGCGAAGGQGESEFIATGRGGLPPNPSAPLSSDTVWSDLRYRTQLAENRTSSAVSTQPTNPIPVQLVEAQGWVINNKGEVVLTATAPTVTSHILRVSSTDCHASQSSF
jgi:large exoprotein involved in heme utilization and adhesion